VNWWKWTGIILAVVLVGGYGALSFMMGGPKDVYGFLRYALPQWRDGSLKVGDSAPNVKLLALDGQTTFHLSDRVGQRPLVLVFGSYT
jgi:Iodothyronine deiodinase